MSEFFAKIEACNPNCENIVLTCLEADALGEKAILSNRQLIWQSRDGGCFTHLDSSLPALCQSGILQIDGKSFFCEYLGQEKRLVICGGGHVSIPVIKIGRMIGCSVTVLEDRPKFADNARRAGANEVICQPFAEGLATIEGSPDTFFIIVTRGHRYDQICLEQILQKEAAYIGMIGSRVRVARVKEALAAKGFDRQLLDQVYSPIGLKIGADTPEEIAVSIMAEVIQMKNQRGRRGGYSREILHAITGENAAAEKKVLATIVARKGSAPREVGTKMLILRDGNTVGTIGGGCLESDIFQQARQLLAAGTQTPCLYRADMTGRDVDEEGMVCGGIIDVLLEVV